VGDLLGVFLEGLVTDLHRVEAPRDLDDGGAPEGGGELFRVDRGGGDDDLEVPAPSQEGFQHAQDEIDVEAALVRLVDDDRVVLVEKGVGLGLHQEDAVRHDLDEPLGRGAVLEADLVAHRAAGLLAHLLGDALGHRDGGHPARLRAADPAVDAPASLEAHLGDLRGLARAGLAGDDDDGVFADGLDDVRPAGGDGQGIGVTYRGQARPALLFLRGCPLEPPLEPVDRGL